jgi:hypothetical protein
MPKQKIAEIIPDERIFGKIYYLRGKKVMFDKDLAALYGVEVRALNQAVKRNSDRFPEDFMFQLNKEESVMFLRFRDGTLNEKNLKSQNVISSWGGSRGLPYVFTEQGVAMLSSVLKSKTAIHVNIQIIRTFSKMREILATHKDLRDKVEKMEKENKENFKVIFKVISKLMATGPEKGELKIIGFTDKKQKKT